MHSWWKTQDFSKIQSGPNYTTAAHAFVKATLRLGLRAPFVARNNIMDISKHKGEMLLNCYNQAQGGPMRAFLVWLYEVSLNYLWFRLPLEDRFSNSLLTLILLPISLHFTTLNCQNNNIKVVSKLTRLAQLLCMTFT